MKIVIIGDGKVGYKLARSLSAEDYDVVLIDSNERKLRAAIDRLDVFCVSGDGGSVEVQKEADVPNADLVIACTSTDECNMLSCLIAKRLGARHTIARVRNPVYYQQIDILKEDLHLSMVVNPELIMAEEIYRLLLFPDASKMETFVKGRAELIEYLLTEKSPLRGMSLADVYKKLQVKILVCAVERGTDVFIPSGDDVLREGDRIHIAASHEDLKQFFGSVGYHKGKIRKVLICGGGSKSAIWRQIFADIYNLPVLKTNIDQNAASLGAAALAANGCGLWDGYGRIPHIHRTEDLSMPDPNANALYETLLPVYRRWAGYLAELSGMMTKA